VPAADAALLAFLRLAVLPVGNAIIFRLPIPDEVARESGMMSRASI
jgi:hypothetical protein